MSGTTEAPAAAADDAAEGFATLPEETFPAAQQPQEQNLLHRLLREKDEEIASLKQAILYQHKEIKKLKQQVPPPSLDLKTQSIQGIANNKSSGGGASNNYHPGSKVDQRWKNRFQQLVAYKLEHGHANVPQSYKDKGLHAWVRAQREAKKDYDKGTVSRMTPERMEALESVGFMWVVGHQSKETQWEESFQALMQYKQHHGHTRVSQSDDKKLYKWVLNQRARRRLLEQNGEGKAKGMTWARVEKLNAIDFCWEASSQRRRSNEPVGMPAAHPGVW